MIDKLKKVTDINPYRLLSIGLFLKDRKQRVCVDACQSRCAAGHSSGRVPYTSQSRKNI